ncbi:hypothetical protein L218DRAFT_1000321 [Marasmius fiardii PR-910]|nr:hypothetical protein L218DRAFT_1000321 [Marasmius fiardii PR-910]
MSTCPNQHPRLRPAPLATAMARTQGPLWEFFHREKQDATHYKAYCYGCLKSNRSQEIQQDAAIDFEKDLESQSWFAEALKNTSPVWGEKVAMVIHLKRCPHATNDAKRAAERECSSKPQKEAKHLVKSDSVTSQYCNKSDGGGDERAIGSRKGDEMKEEGQSEGSTIEVGGYENEDTLMVDMPPPHQDLETVVSDSTPQYCQEPHDHVHTQPPESPATRDLATPPHSPKRSSTQERPLKRPYDALECEPDKPTDTSTLVKSTFKDAWCRFHEWNYEDTRKTIELLRAPIVRRRRHPLFEDDISPAAGSSELDEPGEHSVSVVRFGEGATVTSASMVVQTVEVHESMSCFSTPAYESCPPISRNIMVGDDPNALPFLPFADDPKFNWKDYADQHKKCAWHDPWYMLDSGEAFVTVQTVRQLVEGCGLTAEEIESMAVLPAPLLDSKWRRGILYKESLGDWFRRFESSVTGRSAVASTGFLPRTLLAEKHLTPAMDVSLGSSLLCNRLNCVVSCCHTHFDESPPPPSAVPTATSSQLLYDTIQPCERQCFLYYQSALPSNWTTNDLATLTTVLSFSPDTSPCDLAIICNKPCFEVFRWRRKMIKDETVVAPVPPQNQRSSRNYPLTFEESCLALMMDLVRKKRDVHVLRIMLIVSKLVGVMVRVYADGKVVSVPGWDEGIKYVERIVAHPNSTRCNNVSIQRELKKVVKVREGAWGLGCFVLEPVVTSEFILEYVGQLIFDLTALSRDIVSSHRKRNYVYELNGSLVIDAAYAGNEARYINHDSERVNCKAAVKLVNGEHRIGIYAMRPLEAGTELFLDYGPDFFKAEGEGEMGEDGVDVTMDLERD